MALILTEEQIMVRDNARAFLADKAPVAHLRKLRDSRDTAGFFGSGAYIYISVANAFQLAEDRNAAFGAGLNRQLLSAG